MADSLRGCLLLWSKGPPKSTKLEVPILNLSECPPERHRGKDLAAIPVWASSLCPRSTSTRLPPMKAELPTFQSPGRVPAQTCAPNAERASTRLSKIKPGRPPIPTRDGQKAFTSGVLEFGC